MNSELQKLQTTLDAARIEFNKAETSDAKIKLAEQIRILEPSILTLTKQISNKRKEAINKEINFLFNK